MQLTNFILFQRELVNGQERFAHMYVFVYIVCVCVVHVCDEGVGRRRVTGRV